MTETEFALIDQVLNSIESRPMTGRLDVDVETSRSGNATMVFEDNTHVVVNSQAAMQERSRRSGGFHYRFDGQHWNDTRAAALRMRCRRSVRPPPACR